MINKNIIKIQAITKKIIPRLSSSTAALILGWWAADINLVSCQPRRTSMKNTHNTMIEKSIVFETI